jgi:GH43 family beta-xylosidase
MRRIAALALLLAPVVAAQSTIVNPLLPSGPDPWITSRDGFYYYMNTTGSSLVIRKTKDIAALATAETKTVWRAPESGPYSKDVWAPELHFLRGKWYIYFAADAGKNESHRIWVLENASADPMDGEWVMKGKVADPSDRWAIDATVFEHGGRMYMAWSGWEGEVNGSQNLYLAEMSDPWTIQGTRVRISTPEHPWERVAGTVGVVVNEGPEFLHRGDRVFLVYSASGCWTDSYSLGLLTASADANLLDAASWKKNAAPVFWSSPEAKAFGVGHNGFFRSADGKEDWMIYHANPEAGLGCRNRRSPRAQRFEWKDGAPDFGRPVAVGVAIPGPGR